MRKRAARVPPPPPSRRRFRNPWDELGYCCDKAAHFLLEVGSRTRASRYVARLEALLPQTRSRMVMDGATAKALVAELHRDWRRAAYWRRREAALRGRFHQLTRSRAHLADLAATWRSLDLGMVTRRFRLVVHMYTEQAPARLAARVRAAIAAIRWVEL